jgi:hypothetical protein
MKRKELVLSMKEAKEKLSELQKYMPKNEDTIWEFGRMLSTKLNPELVPEGFVMACELLIYDLQKGVDGFTGQPIRSKLVGYPPMIYALLRMEIPHIASVIFPEEFATAVKDFIQEVNKEAREKQKQA